VGVGAQVRQNLNLTSSSGKATNEPDRPARTYPSLVTPGGSTAPVKTQQYTGTLIMGIATMHKSNLVPVLNGDDAVAVARMRRG
jgi:hypothetical protein